MIELDKIYLGNCIDYFNDIEPESIDLIFSDPPYITALADIYADWNGRNMDFEVYAEIYNRILKDNGQVALFCDFPTAVAITNGFQRYFKYRFYWIWQKSLGQPVNRKQPIAETELVLVFSKKNTKTKELVFNWQDIGETGEPYKKFHKGNNQTRKNSQSYMTVNKSGKRYPKQILKFPAKCNMLKSERTKHPTQKPEALCGIVIKALSNDNDIVLDNFAGSGSIPATALKLKRRFMAMEKDKEFFNIARSRIEQEKNKLTLF